METNKLALCTQGNGIFMHKQHNTYKTPHRTARVDEVTDRTGSGECGQQGEKHSGAKQDK